MMDEEQQAILRGAVLAAVAIEELKHATLGRCEGTIADHSLGRSRRCRSMGVLIAIGYRCPKHGYKRGVTLPVADGHPPPFDGTFSTGQSVPGWPAWTTATFTLDDLRGVIDGLRRAAARVGLPFPDNAVTCAPNVIRRMREAVADADPFCGIRIYEDTTLPPGAWHAGPPRP